MHIESLRNNPARFHSIWNDGAVDFFEESRPNKNKKMSSFIGSVPDPKTDTKHSVDFLGYAVRLVNLVQSLLIRRHQKEICLLLSLFILCYPSLFHHHHHHHRGLVSTYKRLEQQTLHSSITVITRCHAVAGRTARCRYKFRHNGIGHAVTLVHGYL